MKCIVTALMAFFFSCLLVQAQGPDSLQKSKQTAPAHTQVEQAPATTNVDDDFTPFLGVFALAAIGLMIGAFLVGAILVVLALLIFAGFVSAGIISTSVLVGLYKNSFAKGFTTFVILCATAAGGFAGAVGLWFVNAYYDWYSGTKAVLWGATAGIIAGMAFGFLAVYIVQQLTTYFKIKMKIAVQ